MNASELPNPYEAPAPIAGRELVDIRFDRDALMMTGLGLRLMYFGFLAFVSALVLIMGSRFLNGPLLGLLAAGAAGVGGLLIMIGPLFCLSVPTQTGLRPWMLAAVACPFVTVLGAVVARAFGIFVPLEYAWAIGCLFAIAVFLAFLIRLAQYIGRWDLARQGRLTLYGGMLQFLLVIPFGFFFGFPGDILAIVVPAVLAIISLILFVSYVNLIHSLAKLIRRPRPDDELATSA